MNSQERERERISRDLHDELGQSLLVLKLQIRQIARQLSEEKPDIQKECQEALANFDQLIENIRRLSRDLSPTILKDLGLSMALQRLIENFANVHSIQRDLKFLPELDNFFPQETQLNIYRLFQESLTNIGKYAQASNLKVAITRNDGEISFLIEDDGLGFEVEEVLGSELIKRGLGLAAMEERVRMMGGALEINSKKGQGTKILFSVPIPNPESK
jgi:signal transduction histidine kinase